LKEDITLEKEVDPQEEEKDKGTEEERKVELSERFKTIQGIIDHKRRQREGLMSKTDERYFSGTHSGDDVFVKLEDYIRDCLKNGAPADEIEKKLDILEYSVGELLKDNPNREESDKGLTRFIKGRIDHFVATFDKRIEVIKKSGRYDLQEGAIEGAKEKINRLLKNVEEEIKEGIKYRKAFKEFPVGDAKGLMKIASKMEHIIPGVEAGHEAALLFRADDFKEEELEEKPEEKLEENPKETVDIG